MRVCLHHVHNVVTNVRDSYSARIDKDLSYLFRRVSEDPHPTGRSLLGSLGGTSG
jgi:hypothetical protein